MIQLGQSPDGRLVLGLDQPLSSDIKYIEYYSEQKLFSLVLEDDESLLMPCEISKETTPLVQRSASVIVLEVFANEDEPEGYIVPIIQIGV